MPDSPVRNADHKPIILCVEDEDDLRVDLVDELEEAGYSVIEARDGAQAVAQLDVIRPDLILCDVNMPGRNGYDVLHDLRRRRPELADVPFIFLTALADPREVIEGKRAGADDYLVKPIDFDLMLATIEARLRQVSRMRKKVETEIDRMREALQGLGAKAAQDSFRGVCQALDYVTLGVVLLGGQAQILFANRAARSLARESDGLLLEETITSSRAQDTKALRATVDAAIASSASGEDQVSCLSLPRPSGRRDLLLLACPLATSRAVEGAIEAGGEDAPTPAVVVFVSDPERRPRVPDDVLASLFGLTRAESQIAMKLAEGGRMEEIAASLNVSKTTVAYHMRNIFQKTDTHRQADLVALVLAGPMAMVHD
jgi:DNA-binding NarL/FixJ family response regulator